MNELYLLSAQILLDMCSDEDKPAKAWADAVPTNKLRVSVVSVAQARAHCEAMSDPLERRALNNKLNILLDSIAADSGAALPLDEKVASVWQGLNLDAKLEQANVDQTARQVYATALAHGLVVVERSRPYHAYLRTLGLELVSL